MANPPFSTKIPSNYLTPKNSMSMGIGSSIAGGLASAVGGGLIGGITSAIQGRKQRNFQREMLQKQQDFSREMWQKQADYNSPVNQRKMLEEAGYNPQTMMAGQAGYAASSAAPASTSGTYQPMPVADVMANAGTAITSALTARRGQDIDYFGKLTSALNEAESIKNQNARWSVMNSIERQLATLSENRFNIEAVESGARVGKMAAEVSYINMMKNNVPARVANETAQALAQVMNAYSNEALASSNIKTGEQYRNYLYSQTTGQNIINTIQAAGVPVSKATVEYWSANPDKLKTYAEDMAYMPYWSAFWQNFGNGADAIGGVLKGLVDAKNKRVTNAK